ncbi:SanA/YdcF family protein [Bacteroides propionicifaciens]|uniref:SanA/YdcF family protein n=1 Tax=Bacteroides propionicifaciens TaxID=392838 RepID=UPI0003674873|nr:ElyC/SanA/YdcF family protein [Bacteroides propionicifaciens]
MQKIKIIGISISILIIVLLVTIYLCSFYVGYVARDRTYSSLSDIPYNRVGVVLGTSKSLVSGAPNPYFTYRIDAAAALYHAGKIDRIVISGDNREKYYNEPLDMKKALIAQGVHPEHLYIDAAGLRTLDSIVRMNEIFGQDQFTVISQKFHNERAIFLAKSYGLDVVGYNAQDVSLSKGLKVQAREKLARVKVFLDIIFNKQPKHLGESIEIR